MPEIKTVVPEKFAVMPQPSTQDIATLAEQGYRSIINNRPDGEGADQPDANEVRTVAREHGLHYEHMPVTLESITREDVLTFRKSVTLAPDPVVAHCRTGKRSFLLWAAGEVIDGGRSVDELKEKAAAIGLDANDLPALVERVSQ